MRTESLGIIFLLFRTFKSNKKTCIGPICNGTFYLVSREFDPLRDRGSQQWPSQKFTLVRGAQTGGYGPQKEKTPFFAIGRAICWSCLHLSIIYTWLSYKNMPFQQKHLKKVKIKFRGEGAGPGPSGFPPWLRHWFTNWLFE